MRLAELPGERGQGERGAGGGVSGDDGQGERQPRAPRDDLLDGLRLGCHPFRAEALLHQPVRVVPGQQVECHRVSGVRRDQAGQFTAAGHQHHTARRAGEQRADLFGVAGVVQNQQHPSGGHQAAVERDLNLRGVRDPPG
nr:hypothetical protein GCM10020093_008990 [Planobispora longispora]